MPKLTKSIFGVPDGEIYPREIPAGEECPPGLEGYAAEIGGSVVECKQEADRLAALAAA